MSDQALEQLASLQQRLQSYVEGCRRLPGDLADLAAGLQSSADRLAALSDVTTHEPPRRGEAA